MNFKAVEKYIGAILFLEGLLMMPCALLAILFSEAKALYSFLITIAILLLLGYFFYTAQQNERGIYAREGYITVALGWILLSVFGAFPFMISGCIPRFVDAFFETVSGFTTTGASILTAVEWMPKSILYWRNFTHWLGGMGVLVFLMTIVPLGKGKGGGEGLQLMRAESPGPSVGKMTPTLRSTARVLYGIYIALTVFEVLLLCITGMPFFDALLNSFATAGTGGFSIIDAGTGAYSNIAQFIIAVFMALFGINFSIYYLLLLKQINEIFANEEFKVYISIITVATIVIAINIHSIYSSNGKALLDSFFQVCSIITTTGFSTANFDLWPEFSKFILVLLMICGASAGSTGGGMKVSRIIILLKAAKREANSVIRPNSVKTIKVDGKPVSESVVHNTLGYLAIYCALSIRSMFIIALADGYDFTTTVTAVIACVNNIGPGLSLVGPASNYSFLTDISKYVLSFDMLFGRLELFPMLLLFSPNTYKNAKLFKK